MQPEQPAPPAPPPMPGGRAATGHNPYEFIMTETPNKKGGLLPSGSQKMRIIIVAVIGAVLLMVGLVLWSLLASSGSGNRELMLKASQQQAEIIRIAAIGSEKAKGTDAKNLAAITEQTMTSDKIALDAVQKQQKIKLSPKEVALGKNSKNDTALTDAEQKNKFDEAYIEITIRDLAAYQKTLRELQAQAGSKTKTQLNELYTNAGLLIAASPEAK
jgi:hypothetical protein